jgi:DNA-binding transcriptional LysR family regulator
VSSRYSRHGSVFSVDNQLDTKSGTIRVRAKIDNADGALNPEGCGYRAALQHAIQAAGYTLRVKADMHGSEMQLQLIASGLGLGLVTRSVLTHSVWQRRLEVVKVARFAPQLDVWLLHAPHLGNLSRAIAHLRDTMKASFKS